MPLTLYNTLSRRKEPFEPLDPTRVGLYVCGPTVYDRAHIGNARAYVVFDLLYRLLGETYGRDHVRYVRNITDVEDKINAAARQNHEPIAALTARTTAAFHRPALWRVFSAQPRRDDCRRPGRGGSLQT